MAESLREVISLEGRPVGPARDAFMKLYIGNLPRDINDAKLRELVVPFGQPDSATVVMERDSGRSRGFGFVELSSDDQARAAIAGLHGKTVGDRALVVNEARAKKG